MATFFGEIELKDVEVKEYRLCYMFGAWVTKSVIYAENDSEAIFDANVEFANSNLKGWKYKVALFCGNREVKQYVWGK